MGADERLFDFEVVADLQESEAFFSAGTFPLSNESNNNK
jgi:hypothetical protein